MAETFPGVMVIFKNINQQNKINLKKINKEMAVNTFLTVS